MARSKTSSLLPPLGAHMSIAGGVYRAIAHARATDSTALQLFLKNNNQWQGKPISPEDAERFKADLAEAKLAAPPIAHACYLINLASPDPVNLKKSIEAMADELRRAEQIGVPGVIVHPGSHMGEGDEAGLRKVAESINRVHAATAGMKAAVDLETTAGQGTNLGWKFEHLAAIIDQVEDKSRVAVCLDTCHVFAAGYDIRTAAGVKLVLSQFDKIVGLSRLRTIHCNDSLKPFASRRDRHAHIGQGEIGEAGFAALLKDKRLAKIPFILETPKEDDLEDDRINFATLRRLAAAS